MNIDSALLWRHYRVYMRLAVSCTRASYSREVYLARADALRELLRDAIARQRGGIHA